MLVAILWISQGFVQAQEITNFWPKSTLEAGLVVVEGSGLAGCFWSFHGRD